VLLCSFISENLLVDDFLERLMLRDEVIAARLEDLQRAP